MENVESMMKELQLYYAYTEEALDLCDTDDYAREYSEDCSSTDWLDMPYELFPDTTGAEQIEMLRQQVRVINSDLAGEEKKHAMKGVVKELSELILYCKDEEAVEELSELFFDILNLGARN